MSGKQAQIIYISGPMSGYENFNYEAFDETADILRRAGFKVINPAENGDGNQKRSWHDYMRDDIGFVLSVDAVVCLEGWQNSEGAKVEVAVARALGLPVWDVTQICPTVTNNEKDDETWARDHPAAPQKSVDGSLRLTVDTSNADPKLEDFGIPYPFPDQRVSYEVVDVRAEDLFPLEEKRPSILLKAEELINGDRNRDYDHPLDNFQRIADMWTIILESILIPGAKVTPELHALCMIAIKIARLMHSPEHEDSIVDIAGYAGTYEKVLVERRKRA